MKRKIFFSLLLCTIGFWTFSQTPYSSIIGTWEGYLKFSKQDSLLLILAIEQHNDSLWVEFDSPDQYSTHIAVNKFSFHNDTIFCKSKAISAEFIGVYNSAEEEISGIFTQRKNKTPLTLRRTPNRYRFSRPQEPIPPYFYEEKEYNIKDRAGTTPLINGTLTYPYDFSKKTLLIMASGSGWQDRDETIYGHKTFKVLSDFFTNEGYAVYRYDDLPVTIFKKSTTLDFADVISLIIDSLQNEPLFKDAKIGIIGHSEGGLVAAIAAASDTRIDFIISLAGSYVPIKNTLIYQIRAILESDSNYSPSEIEASLLISENVYDIIIKSSSQEKAKTKVGKMLDNYSKNMTTEEKEKLGLTFENRLSTMQIITSNWYYTLLKLQPKEYLKRVKCPILALNGEKDLQVHFAANFAELQRYLPNNAHTQYYSFPNMNHLFQHCVTGAPTEYKTIEETFAPEVMDTMKTWLNNIINQH